MAKEDTTKKEDKKLEVFQKVIKEVKVLYDPDDDNEEIKRILLATAVFYQIDLKD